MKQALKDVLKEHQWADKKILVAVSGGSDSIVLSYLLSVLKVQVVLAHCNFGLRGAESDGDEQLVTAFAKQYDIPCHIKHFDMPALLEKEGGNLQEIARNLRYDWFETLRRELGFDLIATAHHKQDSVETLLMNFFRGTGIAGMHGILPQQGKIIRPLLAFTKEEIQAFAIANDIAWREDSSNQKDHYTRNALRHQLLPVLENIFPNVVDNLAANTQRFAEIEMLYRESVKKYISKIMEQRGNDWYLPVLKLNKVEAVQTLLWEIVQDFGFHAAQLPDIVRLLQAESGKYLVSQTHRIIKSRAFLIITSLQSEESAHVLIERIQETVFTNDFSITLKEETFDAKRLESLKELPLTQICVDAEKLVFPLILRPWKTGDYFCPLGKDAKKKKISKYLIEQKMPVHEKEKVWVLESNQKIIWVLGMRADDRFKMKASSKACLLISLKRK